MSRFSAPAEQFLRQAHAAQIEVERMKKELVEKYVAEGYFVQVVQDEIIISPKETENGN